MIDKEKIQEVDVNFLIRFLEQVTYIPMHEKYQAKLTSREIWNVYFLIEYKIVKMKNINIVDGNFIASEVFRDPRADLLLEILKEEPNDSKWEKAKKGLGNKLSKTLEIALGMATQIGAGVILGKIT